MQRRCQHITTLPQKKDSSLSTLILYEGITDRPFMQPFSEHQIVVVSTVRLVYTSRM